MEINYTSLSKYNRPGVIASIKDLEELIVRELEWDSEELICFKFYDSIIIKKKDKEDCFFKVDIRFLDKAIEVYSDLKKRSPNYQLLHQGINMVHRKAPSIEICVDSEASAIILRKDIKFWYPAEFMEGTHFFQDISFCSFEDLNDLKDSLGL